MKKVNYLVALVALMAVTMFTACEKNEVEPISSEILSSIENLTNISELNTFAKLISDMDVNIEMVKEVNKGVKESLKKGYDEDLTFKEILEPIVNPTSETRSGGGTNFFASALLSKLKSNSTTRSTLNVQDLLAELEEKGINLYWPYSENWDGVTMPVITFDPKGTQDWNYAYELSSLSGQTRVATEQMMIVDEEYAMKNPVWVINESERIEEEWELDNEKTILVDNLILDKNIPSAITNTTPEQKNVYSVYLGTLQITKQFDSWFRGGSEIIIQAGAPKNFDIKDNGSLTSLGMYTSYKKLYVSRGDIDKGKIHSLNYLLVGDWQDPLNEIGFMLHEEDPRSRIKELNVKVSAEYKKVKGEFEVKFDMQEKDELITKQIYQRGYIFSTNNLIGSNPVNWYKDSTLGAKWTLPYKIGTSTI